MNRKWILSAVTLAAVVALAWQSPLVAADAASAPTAKPAASRPAEDPNDRPVMSALPSLPPQAKKAPWKLSTLQAATIGLVQGLTEFLPVSSTGHMILVNHLMGLEEVKPANLTPAQEAEFDALDKEKKTATDAYDVIMHLGTLLAVLGLYRRRVGQMIQGLRGRDADGLRLFKLLLIAFVPAAIIGKLFHHKIEDALYGPIPVAAALAVGGVLMIVIEMIFRPRISADSRVVKSENLQYWQAFVIGLAQCVALWPGTSRSMMTILAGLIIGLDIITAAEFSFLLALPTIGAATVYKGITEGKHVLQAAGIDGLIIGLVVSAVVGALSVKFLLRWLTSHKLLPFGVYRIILAAAVYYWLVIAHAQ